MQLDPKTFTKQLIDKLKTFDKKGATLLCDELISYLYKSSEPFATKEAKIILQNLRNKRMFEVMQKVADALIQTNRHSLIIRRQYAQSLIETGNYTAALCILNALSEETKNSNADKIALNEFREAQGLIGRVYKQLYVNADDPANPQNIDYLKRSVNAYNNIYCTDIQSCLWHGINVAAMLYRAKADGIELQGFPGEKELAEKILAAVEEKYEDAEQRADAWDFAIAAEACIALHKPEDAVKWLSGYFRDPYVDAFELGSTLRQMEEVWKLNMDSETGKLILPLLRSQLLQREGGNVLIEPEELKQQKVAEESTKLKYQNLLSQTGENKEKNIANNGLEKVFGHDSYNSYKWMMTATDRGLAVARIGRDSSTGFGTGFLLHGKALHEKLADELVLITNAHVVSNDPAEKSLSPYEAVIIFEALSRDEEFSVSEIIWSSPSDELDCTILRFDGENTARLKELTKKVKIYPLAFLLPILPEGADSTQRVYIIGHPAGGTLQFSLQDNLLLDYEDPKIHYRTPTVGGSSGSPVFNAKWDLIGLHHAGRTDMPKLKGKEGTYEANEGIWIQAVRNKLKNVL